MKLEMIFTLLFFYPYLGSADPADKKGTLSDGSIISNAPGLFLPGSSEKEIVKLLGKPSFKGSETLIYRVKPVQIKNQILDKEAFNGIVVFHLSKGFLKYAESISTSGKIVLSTYKMIKKTKD